MPFTSHRAKEPQQKEIRDKKYFWFSGFGKYSEENNGDGDYVKQMIAILKSEGKDAEWIKTVGESDYWKNYTISLKKEDYGPFNNNNDRKVQVQKIIDHIKANSTDKDPVFHLTIRAPETGYIITPTDLLDFKKQGIQVVVTCHEYLINRDRAAFKLSSLAYFQNADQVIFVNEKSKTQAIKDCERYEGQKFHNIDAFPFPSKESLEQKSTFCPIPPTIKPKQEEDKNIDTITNKILERPSNILVFGNFRRLKGFETDALDLVKAIDAIKKGEWGKIKLVSLKNSFDTKEKKLKLQDKFKDTKIIFAGSISTRFPDIYRKIAEASFDYPDTIELHPNPSILGFNSKADLTNKAKIEAAASRSFLSEEELAALSKRCLYAFKGDQTGMRDNASGIISSMALGCITFCKTREDTDDAFLDTPPALKKGHFSNGYIKLDSNAGLCPQIINKLSSLKPENLKKIAQKQQELLQTRFGPKNINLIHDKVYNKLLAIDDKSELVSTTPKEQKDLSDLNLLLDLVAGPSHHRNSSDEETNSKKAKVTKQNDLLIFENQNGRKIHKGLVPFVLGFDAIKDKKVFVKPSFSDDYQHGSFNQFCIDTKNKQLFLGTKTNQSQFNSS